MVVSKVRILDLAAKVCFGIRCGYVTYVTAIKVVRAKGGGKGRKGVGGIWGWGRGNDYD